MSGSRNLLLAKAVCLSLTVALFSTSLQASEISPLLQESEERKMIPDTYPYQRQCSTRKGAGMPLATFASDHFIGSGLCANCHDLLRDAAGNDMSIANHWRSTMMANASRDPFWQAKVASEIDRNPAIKSLVEEKCAACHMPMAYTESQTSGLYRPAIFDSGFLNTDHLLHRPAMDGVSCSLCHQIQDRNLGGKNGFSGKFVVDTDLASPDRPIFGPFRDPVQRAMRTSVGFTPEFGSQINASELCATCHNLFTPYLDADGNIAGEFPEQTPYLEWRHSIYGQSSTPRRDIGETDPGYPAARICQECHMPHSPGGPVMIARWAPPETQPREHFSQHHFVGGNVMMLDLLQENAAGLGLTASSKKMEATRQRTLEQLQTATAELDIGHAARDEQQLEVQVHIRSRAGHKFPTGFPARRAWLHLQVLEADKGNILFESGRPLADGSIAGNDNDLDPYSFEPHYEVISSGEEVQVYETIMFDTDNEVTYTLLRAAGYLKDNRLLPDGFNKKTAGKDIAVFGQAAADDNFRGGGDTVTYRIDLPQSADRIAVRATLLYSSLSNAFYQDLSLDDELAAVRRFTRMLQKTDRLPTVIATAEALL